MAEAEQRQAGTALVLLGPATILMLVMLIAPLALLARVSLNRFDPTELMVAAVTPANYARFFTDPFYRDVLVTTVRVAAIVTMRCLILGVPMAWRLARTTSRWKSALVVLIILPLFIGSATRTSGWMILFARGGMLDRLAGLNLMYAEPAVIAGIIAINLPFTVLALQACSRASIRAWKRRQPRWERRRRGRSGAWCSRLHCPGSRSPRCCASSCA